MAFDFSNDKEIEIIKDLIDRDSSYTIDLGANTGIFTKIMAENSKHVYALEPEPENFRQLTKNMEPFDNVSLYDYAASNTTGSGTLHLCNANPGMHRLYPSVYCPDGEVRVKTIRVDDLIIEQEKGVEEIDFIKMDVEGFEYFVTLGMADLLRRDKPTILSEFHPSSIAESGADPRRIYVIMLSDFGYSPPMHCITGEVLDTYEKLREATSDPRGGVNILWP